MTEPSAMSSERAARVRKFLEDRQAEYASVLDHNLDFEQVSALILQFSESELSRLQQENERLQSERFEFGKSPFCEHNERYLFTDDGGKHIICTLCEKESAERELKALQQEIRQKDAYISQLESQAQATARQWCEDRT